MKPSRITVHCSASQIGRYLTVNELRKFHTDPPPKGRGWSDVGYHFIIRTDGAVDEGRPLTVQGAHVAGHNKDNIGICLIGGINRKGEPVNNFNEVQFHVLYALIRELCQNYGISYADVCGHTDLNPNKACPCFDVQEWLCEKLKSDGVEYGVV